MTNERFKNITFVSCAIGWIGGAVCVIKEAVEKRPNVKGKDVIKTFG